MIGTTGTAHRFIVALATLGLVACDGPTTSADRAPRPSFLTAATVITGMRGSGAIGSGAPTFYGVDRQVFDVEFGMSATGAYGRLDYVDSAFVKEDGNYPRLVAGPGWPGTAVASFVQTSDACVAVDGVGRLLNTGELLAFQVEACDHGQPGAGRDVFGIYVPQRLVTHGGIYRAGPALLARGELTLSGTP